MSLVDKLWLVSFAITYVNTTIACNHLSKFHIKHPFENNKKEREHIVICKTNQQSTKNLQTYKKKQLSPILPYSKTSTVKLTINGTLTLFLF